MKLIVLDLEHTQPSGKIIQIGAVFVDLKRNKVIDTLNKYIDPGEPIHPEITLLTGITDDDVKYNEPADVFSFFWQWVQGCNCGKKLAAWGNDVYHLRRQSIDNGACVPEKIHNIDIKYLFELVSSASGGKQRGGLKNCLDLFGFEFEGKQHNALDDAKNTATLMFYLYNSLRIYFLTEGLFKKGV